MKNNILWLLALSVVLVGCNTTSESTEIEPLVAVTQTETIPEEPVMVEAEVAADIEVVEMETTNVVVENNDESAVIQALVDTMEANDADGIRALFADDAQQAYGAGSPKSGAAFRSWLESDIIGVEGLVANPEVIDQGNGAVVLQGEYRNNNGYTSAADFLFQVENGLITSWTMRY